jgi:hypothetical protein
MKVNLKPMKWRKILKSIYIKIFLILLFFSSFSLSIAHAIGKFKLPKTVEESAPLLLSSLILFVCIPMLIVFVLIANNVLDKNKYKTADKQTQFETERLYFAAVVLTGLALVFLESMVMYYWAPKESKVGQEIFDTCKTVVPPIVTLVIGYYFGRTDQHQQIKDNTSSQTLPKTSPDDH